MIRPGPKKKKALSPSEARFQSEEFNLKVVSYRIVGYAFGIPSMSFYEPESESESESLC